ncbi:glycoside hydrolase family 108 protein [Nitratireductor aquimarinus]|uniref:glycoside hydrolase family 108 protein n=1 Tax=Nitratireductor aquimarinus TaxID=889300 RepID=UPI002935DE78|nr:glycoside hydrolase family 108 protein [Nitratireductor aquimarinus]MDV2964534.1 glycoside hydrolase family 108 protein [Nitratireductor aquimarinus]
MDRNFARALPLVLKHEGGWADHPDDPGGATMKGVTLSTFRRYVKPDATKADLRAITDEQVATVYYRHYWAAVNAQALPSGIDYAVFDFAVNSGPSRAAKFLQRVLGVGVDGRVGPKTIAAAKSADPFEVIDNLCRLRLEFLRKLKHWPTFKGGWIRRVSDVRLQAERMVGRPADVKKTVPPAVEEEVKRDQKNRWWQWPSALGLTGVATFTRDNPEIAAALFGLAVIIGIVALVGGRRLVRRVKDIADEVRG